MDYPLQFKRKANFLYEMVISGEFKHRLVQPEKLVLYGFVIDPKFESASGIIIEWCG